ncbi:unnamed protein product [Amoebophrya sp. A120]|nr:unnamed protein product [Amoebophrya sp. A120]|eukprot:GSA120T00016989001.1
MPGKNTVDRKKKRENVRHFRVVQKPILDDNDEQKNYLEPYLPINVRKNKKLDEEEEEKLLYKPIKGVDLDAKKIFGLEQEDCSEEENEDDEQHQPKNKRLNQVFNSKTEGYIRGADYDSDEELLNEEVAEEETYFPNDGYDYNQHLRVMDERFVQKAEQPVTTRAEKIASKVSANLPVQLVQTMEGMKAPIEEVKQKLQKSDKIDIMELRDADTGETAGTVQELTKPVTFRDEFDSRVAAAEELPADVLEALEMDYEEIPEEAEGDAFQEWDDFFHVAGGVEDKLTQLWGQEGAEFAKMERVRRGVGILNLRAGESLFGNTNKTSCADGEQSDEEESDNSDEDDSDSDGTSDEADQDEDAEEDLDPELAKLYADVDKLDDQRLTAKETLTEFRLRQMLEEGYDDTNLGELDPEEVNGEKEMEEFDDILDEYLEEKATVKRFWQQEMLTLNPGKKNNSANNQFRAMVAGTSDDCCIRTTGAGVHDVLDEIDPAGAEVDQMNLVPAAPGGKFDIDQSTGRRVIMKEQFSLEDPLEKGFRDSKKSKRMKTVEGKTRLGPGLLDCVEDYEEAGRVSKTDVVVVEQEDKNAASASSDTEEADVPATEHRPDALTENQGQEHDHQCSFYEKPTKDIILARVEKMAMEEKDEPETEDETNKKVLKLLGYKEKTGVEFDCETILSTRSNLSNHPGKILVQSSKAKKKQAKKNGLLSASGAGGGGGSLLGDIAEEDEEQTTDDEEDEDSDADSNAGDNSSDAEEDEELQIVEIPDRKKGETKEEKKARKQAVKQARKLCRQTKKENTALFAQEAAKRKREKKTATTGDVRQGARVFAI